MHTKLNNSITEILFPGIQQRLSSNISEISNSGLVLFIQVIASRVGQLMNSKEIIEFTIEDYINKKEYSENEASDEEKEMYNKRKIYYIEDMMQGLLSKDRDKLINSLKAASELILQNLSDLDLYLERLAEVLLKIENSFDVLSFEEHRFSSVVALMVTKPLEMCDILIKRLSDRGCSIAGKLLVLDVIREASRKLSNPPDQEKAVVKEKKSKYYEIQQRLIKKTRRFASKPKPFNPGKANLFFPYFEMYCSGIIQTLNDKMHYLILTKGIYTLSELIEYYGPSCNSIIINQCVYIIKNVIKPFISYNKREVVESVLILFIAVAQKLEFTDFAESFASVIEDLHDIGRKIEGLSGDMQDLADKCLLHLIKYRL